MMQKGQNIHFTPGWKFSIFSPRWKVRVSQIKFTPGWNEARSSSEVQENRNEQSNF